MNLPEGWPTDAMVDSGVKALNNGWYINADETCAEIFKAMFASAPTPPAQEDGTKHDSYLTNCCVIGRGETDSPLFVGSGDKVFCRLDRYTIIPTEQYDELRKATEELFDGQFLDG